MRILLMLLLLFGGTTVLVGCGEDKTASPDFTDTTNPDDAAMPGDEAR